MLRQQFKFPLYNCKMLSAIIKLETEVFHRNLFEIYQNDQELQVIYIESDGELVGYVTYKEHEISYDIYMIAVAPNWQRQGIATELLTNFQNKDIILEVSQENKQACEFYLKNGFKKIKELKNYYHGTPGWFLIRRK